MAACTCADPMAVSQSIEDQTSTLSSGQQTINKTLHGEALGSPPGAMSPVRFCHWVVPEVTPAGESAWATAFQGAGLAISMANAAAQAEISAKQMDLAEGYYDQAKYKWDRFSGKYKPLEIALLNEVSTTPVRKINCDDASSRARISVTTAFTGTMSYMTRKAKSLRLRVDPSLVNMVNVKQAVAYTDSWNFNITDEQWYTDYKNDQRWNRRSNILNLGRNLSSEALKYGEVARQLYGQVGAQLDRAAGGIMQALGYYGARNDTVYPTAFLNSPSPQLISTNPQPVQMQSNPTASSGAEWNL